MDWIFLAFGLIAALHEAITIEQTTYNRENSLSGKKPSDARPISVRSRSQCAILCGLDSECRGFYYTDTVRECFLELTSDFTIFQDDAEGVYYAKIVPVDNTPIPTTPYVSPTTAPVCPSTFHEDVFIEDSSGRNYTFKFLDVGVTQPDGLALCNTLGLQLFKLNDDVKIQELRTFLLSCPVYSTFEFWSDVERQTSEDGMPWWNSDENVVANSQWCGGRPDNGFFEYCARFNPSCSFMLVDIPCVSPTYMFSVICEEVDSE